MFTPRLKRPQAKSASLPTLTCASKPPRRLAKDASANHQVQEPESERITSREAVQGMSWDFNMVPVFAPDLRSQSEPAPPHLQRKLAIGSADDPLEHETDRIADEILRMPASPTAPVRPSAQVGQGCASCDEEHEVLAERADPAQGPVGEAPPLVHQVLNSGGRPLDAAIGAYFEPRFKHDFSAVRIHTDAQAGESARQVNSLAYTVGTNIVFRSDTYAPDTAVGKRLLAHELAHVVQQCHASENRPPPMLRNPGDLAEQEPELAANGLIAGQRVALPRGTRTATHAVQRTPGPAPRPAPSPPRPAPAPPEWLGPLRARARHLHGDIWEIQIPGLGRSPVGPHDQMQAYLRVFNQNRPRGVEPMQSAHIIGGEHIRDLGWEMAYNKAPCIGVSESLHDRWTREISNLQSQQGPMGGRTTATAGRAVVGPEDVKDLYNEVYRDFPQLRDMSERIVDFEAKRIMRAKYGMPKPKPPMEAHQGGMPKPKSPMEAHQGGMPKPKSPMEVHQGRMPKPKPVPEPEVRFPRLRAAKGGFVSGLKAAFSAENLASLIPDVILAFADKAAAEEAIKTIQIKFLKEGFAKGVAAGVMRWSEHEVASNLKNRVTPFRIRGLEDPAGFLTRAYIFQLAEAYENYGVDLGYQFTFSKTVKWNNDVRDKGVAVLAEYGYHFGQDPNVLFEYDFIDKLGWVLRHITDPIIEAAIH
jgi:hypothetical protein